MNGTGLRTGLISDRLLQAHLTSPSQGRSSQAHVGRETAIGLRYQEVPKFVPADARPVTADCPPDSRAQTLRVLYNSWINQVYKG